MPTKQYGIAHENEGLYDRDVKNLLKCQIFYTVERRVNDYAVFQIFGIKKMVNKQFSIGGIKQYDGA